MKLLSGIFVALNLVIMNTQVTAETISKLDIQGHRGARAVLPENSIPAFKYALEIGVDTLELDLGVSADDVVVVAHDQDIDRTLCRDAKGNKPARNLLLRSLTLAQIKDFDCGSIRNPRFEQQQTITGTRIPTLKQVFELVTESPLENASSVRFNIETKSDPRQADAQPKPHRFIELILELVYEFGLQDRLTIQSFDHRTLVAAREQDPKISLAALFGKRPKDWIEAMKAAEANIVSPRFTLIDKEDIELFHRAGYKVLPWTPNTLEDWRALIDMGVDGIITDDPKPLMEYLGRAN